MPFKLSVFVELEEEVNKEARFVAKEILERVVKTTPIDTGAAKGNWFTSLGAPDRTTDSNRRAAASLSAGFSLIDSASNIKFPQITISNSLDYIGKLNNGSSQQAPAKFVEIAILNVVNKRETS